MKNSNRKRGQQSTKDKLVLLFPSQERLAGSRIEGSRDCRSCTGKIMRRGAWSGVVNKRENSLTNQIRLHLHTPKQIIVVGKFEINNLLGIGEGNKNCCCSRRSHGCVGGCGESRDRGGRIWRRGADINASSSTNCMIHDDNRWLSCEACDREEK